MRFRMLMPMDCFYFSSFGSLFVFVGLLLGSSGLVLASPPGSERLDRLLQLAVRMDDDAACDILVGIQAGLRGQNPKCPKAWPACYAKWRNADGRMQVESTKLGLVFGDAAAQDACLSMIRDPKVGVQQRQAMISAAANARVRGLDRELLELLADGQLRLVAIRGLGKFKNAKAVSSLLAGMPEWSDNERMAAVSVLASRESSALELCRQIKDKRVARDTVPPPALRQLRGMKNAELRTLVQEIWGTQRKTDSGRRRQITRLKNLLVAPVLAEANLKNGQLLCRKNCLICHKLHDEGKEIGPNLTGAQRYDLFYLLSNIIDPAAEIGPAYQLHQIETEDGRVLSGIVTAESKSSLELQTATDQFVLSKREDIAERSVSQQSMMPEGIFDTLKQSEIRDLIGFLMSDFQPPPSGTSQGATK